MWTFDRKPRSVCAYSLAAKPQAPPANALWFRMATSSHVGAADLHRKGTLGGRVEWPGDNAPFEKTLRGGEPVDPASRAYFEPRFEQDLGRVPASQVVPEDDPREKEAAAGPFLPPVSTSKPAGASSVTVANLLGSPGRALDAVQRVSLLSRLGPKVDEIRIHDDAHANNIADALGARAFAIGRHVALSGEAASGPGRRKTLEHEAVHAVHHAAASTIFRQPKKPRKEDPKEAERAKLEADYAAAVTKPNWEVDWEVVVRLLDAFDDDDIKMKLRKLAGTDQAEIRSAARKAMPGLSDRIVNAVDAVNADAKRIADVIDKYETALRMPDWGNAAIALNGFHDDDIKPRLRRLKLADLAALKVGALAVMPGWANRLVDLIEARLSAEARVVLGGEKKALAHLQNLATKAATEADGAAFQKAVLAFKKQLQIDLESVPVGSSLPNDLKIVVQALLLWDIDNGHQWGEGSWDSRDFTPSAADYAVVPAAQNKCNAFLGEVIFKALGVVHHGHLKEGMKKSDARAWFPYRASEWSDSTFQILNFPIVSPPPVRGDILCTGSHVGIYLGSYAGKDIYISARDDAMGLFAQNEQFPHGIQIKYTKPGIYRRYTP